MRRSLTILLILGFAAMPFWLIASANAGCADSACEQAVEVADEDAAHSCCVQEEPGTPDDTEAPGEHGDGCDCPLSCCGIVKTIAAVTNKLRKAPAAPRAENSVAPAHDVCGSPHIKRLKRPPRPMTNAV